MTPKLVDTPVLATTHLVLRAPKTEDFAAMKAFFSSPRASFVGGPIEDARQQWNVFAGIIGMWVLRGFGSFIVTRKGNDQALGMTGPWYPETWPEKEIGWTCWDPNLEGTGVMFEAATATIDHVFRDLGWTTAVSYVDPSNTRSSRLAERLGAVLDAEAKRPPKDPGCLVFRHPFRGGLA